MTSSLHSPQSEEEEVESTSSSDEGEANLDTDSAKEEDAIGSQSTKGSESSFGLVDSKFALGSAIPQFDEGDDVAQFP